MTVKGPPKEQKRLRRALNERSLIPMMIAYQYLNKDWLTADKAWLSLKRQYGAQDREAKQAHPETRSKWDAQYCCNRYPQYCCNR